MDWDAVMGWGIFACVGGVIGAIVCVIGVYVGAPLWTILAVSFLIGFALCRGLQKL